ncbi:hypothetical protein P4O66_004555 [Electrophorus voltai]|uniref:Reverse transcriptase domain-containing protein n=1 Tax=Electrophorus voltai TaxID=2609070 RepID=A0AAD8ZLK3_9TELE|nr:hypothetical protein P4O66_004555 [Electrophorus voltai]
MGCDPQTEIQQIQGTASKIQDQQSGSRSLWQGLQRITDYRSPPSRLMSADESLVNELNTFFARFEATSSSTTTNSASANGTIGAANGACAEPTIEQRPFIITESDVRKVFNRVNTRKAVGPDGICRRVLKACADQLAPVFTDIFSLSLTLGIVPSSFKRSTTVPIPKKPRPSGLNDCRPVALTSVVMKCFEKLVGDFITSSLPASMDPLQFAYRHSCSTDDAVAHLLHTTLTHLDKGRATSGSTIIVKFADDTVVMGLISDNDERAYLEEIKQLENWCQENNLLLNVRPVLVPSYKLPGKEGSSASLPPQTPRDFRLPSKVLRIVYTCTVESILTGDITVWFGNSTKQDRQALQRVVCSAERITHTELPDLQTIYYKWCQTKARRIVKDPTHPNNRLFSLLRSGKRFCSLKTNTERLKRSFFPQAIRALNQGN